MIVRVNNLQKGEHPDIIQDVRMVVADADKWLDTPNDRLGGQMPRDLISTPDEIQLRYLIRAIKYGGIT